MLHYLAYLIEVSYSFLGKRENERVAASKMRDRFLGCRGAPSALREFFGFAGRLVSCRVSLLTGAEQCCTPPAEELGISVPGDFLPLPGGGSVLASTSAEKSLLARAF